MTLVELSLYMEGYENRLRREDRAMMQQSWTTALLQRTSKFPSLEIWMAGDKAKKLTPEEAAQEQERHAKLTKKLTRKTNILEGEDADKALQEFVKEQDRLFRERNAPPNKETING